MRLGCSGPPLTSNWQKLLSGSPELKQLHAAITKQEVVVEELEKCNRRRSFRTAASGMYERAAEKRGGSWQGRGTDLSVELKVSARTQLPEHAHDGARTRGTPRTAPGRCNDAREAMRMPYSHGRRCLTGGAGTHTFHTHTDDEDRHRADSRTRAQANRRPTVIQRASWHANTHLLRE